MKYRALLLSVFICCSLFVSSVEAVQILNFEYSADYMPRDDGWTIINYSSYESGHVTPVSGGILHMNDPYSYGSTAAHYYRDFENLRAESLIAVEWDVQAVYSNTASYFAIDDGVSYFAFEIKEGSIRNWNNGTIVSADTTGGYYTYRAELEDGDFRLFQNGELLMDGIAAASISPSISRAHFGLGSSAGTAEFFLDEIRGYEITSTPVPEPATMLLLGSGLAGLAGFRRKFKKA